MWPVWARLIVAPPARGHLEVTLSVFLDSGGSWSFSVQEIYIKSNVRLLKNTHVFEPSFSDIYFTGWFYFSDIFSVFAGLTGFIPCFLNFFYYFIFPLYFTVTCIYDQVTRKNTLWHKSIGTARKLTLAFFKISNFDGATWFSWSLAASKFSRKYITDIGREQV